MQKAEHRILWISITDYSELISGNIDISRYRDVCVLLASCDGNAFRHSKHGSFLYFTLSRCLRFHENVDFESIMRNSTIKEIEKVTTPLGGQRPVLLSTLRKNLQLRFRNESGTRTTAEKKALAGTGVIYYEYTKY